MTKIERETTDAERVPRVEACWCGRSRSKLDGCRTAAPANPVSGKPAAARTKTRASMAQPAASTGPPDQRTRALARANEVRIARATLKRELREGTIGIEQILAIPPEYIATAEILDLLVAVPRSGR